MPKSSYIAKIGETHKRGGSWVVSKSIFGGAKRRTVMVTYERRHWYNRRR